MPAWIENRYSVANSFNCSFHMYFWLANSQLLSSSTHAISLFQCFYVSVVRNNVVVCGMPYAQSIRNHGHGFQLSMCSYAWDWSSVKSSQHIRAHRTHTHLIHKYMQRLTGAFKLFALMWNLNKCFRFDYEEIVSKLSRTCWMK